MKTPSRLRQFTERNPKLVRSVLLGLAFLVATLNGAPPEVGRAVLSYLIVSALTIVPYAWWRGRVVGATERSP